MSSYYRGLKCSKCGLFLEPSEKMTYLCPDCGGIMETQYEYDKEFVERLKAGKFDAADVLPIQKESYVEIGQGNTPMVDATRLSAQYGISLKMKSEFLNPTGSFKDRPVSSGISWANAHVR